MEAAVPILVVIDTVLLVLILLRVFFWPGPRV
jgi:hypothetical protein